MKNIITLFFCVFMAQVLSAQRIVDSNLADAIRWTCPLCIDANNQLTQNARTIKSITLTNHITDLTGMEGFSNLTLLNVSDNDILVLPYLPTNLVTLHCANNRLTQLPNLPIGLTTLKCSI